MSEFSNTKANRIEKLKEVSGQILKTANARSFIVHNKHFIPTVLPSDFITLFDEIIREGYAMEDIKVLTNKVLNIFHIPIRDYKRIEPEPDSFIGILEQNNRAMEEILDRIRPVFKSFAKDYNNNALRHELIKLFGQLEVFVKHYTVKENVLFPVLEECWPDYRCLKIMWSFHDDIRRNLKEIMSQLNNGNINSKLFNRCTGDIFFNMLAIKFREEKILFPHIIESIDAKLLDSMKSEGSELGFPYIQPQISSFKNEEAIFEDNQLNLKTGSLTTEQIRLIFNHLPVDITYVDEDNKVRYFSSPAKRIFPRTIAVIGRDVSNCHPHESVHIVEKILNSFRKGEKDHADFRIRMKGEYIRIQYFAVRDEQGIYKGVIEVSQDITEIKALEGEKRLLDW